MNQNNLFSTSGKTSNDRFLLTLEYCGNCHGTCDGCPLSQDQLMNSNSFFDLKEEFERINSILNDVSHTRNVAIEFGRGNHLTLIEDPWDNLKWFIEEMSRLHTFNHLNIEISTSLIGNFNYQLDKAKSLVDLVRAEEDIDVKFVIVANTNIESIPYWNKITSFLKIMEEYRNIDEYGDVIDPNQDFCGDVLLLNLFPKQIPDIHFLYRQICGIKSPINLAWWLNDDKNLTINEYDMLSFESFLSNFVKYVDFKKIDTSFHDVVAQCSDSGYDMLDNKEILQQMTDNAVTHIDMHNNTKKLFFSPVGILDHEKKICNSSDMTKLDTENYAKDMLKHMSKRSSCTSCEHFKRCLYSGMMNMGYFNTKGAQFPDNVCPLGAKSAFDHLFLEESDDK